MDISVTMCRRVSQIKEKFVIIVQVGHLYFAKDIIRIYSYGFKPMALMCIHFSLFILIRRLTNYGFDSTARLHYCILKLR